MRLMVFSPSYSFPFLLSYSGSRSRVFPLLNGGSSSPFSRNQKENLTEKMLETPNHYTWQLTVQYRNGHIHVSGAKGELLVWRKKLKRRKCTSMTSAVCMRPGGCIWMTGNSILNISLLWIAYALYPSLWHQNNAIPSRLESYHRLSI